MAKKKKGYRFCSYPSPIGKAKAKGLEIERDDKGTNYDAVVCDGTLKLGGVKLKVKKGWSVTLCNLRLHKGDEMVLWFPHD